MKKEDLSKMRHSLSHVMAHAVSNLYPGVKFSIGPVIDNGFYYDFDFGELKIGDDDLKKIEKEMKNIIKKNYVFEKRELDIEEAIEKEKKAGQIYKKELLQDLQKDGEKKVSYYALGEFEDLCSGPHLEKIGKEIIGNFKLDKIAGAYFKGDEKNKMLTRIYGIAFESKEKVTEYIEMLEEAKKRDHRKIGQELELFHINEKVGLGLPLWHPNGAILWKIVENHWHKRHLDGGYSLVRSPHIGSRALWETSGHWGFYGSDMYPSMEVGQTLKEQQEKDENKEQKKKEEYLLKPMNCPFHIEIYKHSPKSYRDLPIRWAECGTVYRYEKKGELSGLVRVRGFTQDDAHIVCEAGQVEEELKRVIDFIISIFADFGFGLDLINVYLSLRDEKDKDKYAGNDEGWEFTENILRKVAKEKKLNFIEEKGEAAFYGPKLDFKLKDVIGREWQCSTLQFDFNLPERFDMSFINKKGEAEKPYVLHRALFGSFERFLALLIEHYAGAFPVWLSPVQVKLISVGEDHIDYCESLKKRLEESEVRVKIDKSSETVGNKIRKATMEKVPYLLVIGDKEVGSDMLAIRDRGFDKIREVSEENFIAELRNKNDLKE